MQGYDIVMLTVLAVATLFGAWKGLAWQIASLGSIFLSSLVALRFREPASHWIDAQPPLNTFAAMLILYLGTSLAVWIGFRWVKGMIDRVRLREFDRHVGALFGLAKGVVLCVIITLFAITLLDEPRRQSIVNSYSGRYIALLLDRSQGVMPEEVHDVIAPYLETLESTPAQDAWPDSPERFRLPDGARGVPVHIDGLAPAQPAPQREPWGASPGLEGRYGGFEFRLSTRPADEPQAP